MARKKAKENRTNVQRIGVDKEIKTSKTTPLKRLAKKETSFSKRILLTCGLLALFTAYVLANYEYIFSNITQQNVGKTDKNLNAIDSKNIKMVKEEGTQTSGKNINIPNSDKKQNPKKKTELEKSEEIVTNRKDKKVTDKMNPEKSAREKGTTEEKLSKSNADKKKETNKIKKDIKTVKEITEKKGEEQPKQRVVKMTHKAITNAYDEKIIQVLKPPSKLMQQKKFKECFRSFDDVLARYPQSPRATHGKAHCLDNLGATSKDTGKQDEAIETYGRLAQLPRVPEFLLKQAFIRKAGLEWDLQRKQDSLRTLELLNELVKDDVEAIVELLEMHSRLKNIDRAFVLAEKVLSLEPDNGLGKCLYGIQLLKSGRIKEGVRFMQEGVESNAEGVHRQYFYSNWGEGLVKLGDEKEAWKVWEQGAERGLFLSPWQRSFENHPNLRAIPFWSKQDFKYKAEIKLLESNWKVIRDEGLRLHRNGEFKGHPENLTHYGAWKDYKIFSHGRPVVKNIKGAARTYEIVNNMRMATRMSKGTIKFSLMEPNTHVWRHTGPTNTRTRVHLGLKIPKDVHIRVGSEARTWDEGKCMIIDDSIDHEVYNNNPTEWRMILIVDFWHQDIPLAEIKKLMGT